MANLGGMLLLNVINNIENAEEQQRLREEANDAFELSDYNFIKLFRLRKEDVENLEEILTPFMNQRQRISGLPMRIKLLAALRFFAGGSYQLDVGSNHTVAISQPSVSRSLHEIIDAFNNPLVLNQYIHFPHTVDELRNIRQRFFNKYGLPGIIGCIDCTHVAIVTPLENEHLYVNRKRYHSLNVQMICDEQLKIINVNARYPGSTHDSFIWQNSNVYNFLRNLPAEHRGSFYLFADSGYALRPWMLTPFLPQPPPHTPEAAYNVTMRRIRSTIEQCYGQMKNRFRCLLKHRTLHYSPETAGKIINACAVLHNICIENNVPLYLDDEGVEDGNEINNNNYGHEDLGNDIRHNNDLEEGRRVRQMLVRNHFNI